MAARFSSSGHEVEQQVLVDRPAGPTLTGIPEIRLPPASTACYDSRRRRSSPPQGHPSPRGALAQMLTHLNLQRGLQHPLRELRHQPTRLD